MSALTSPRSTWIRALPSLSLPLPVGYKVFEGSQVVLDTTSPDGVFPAASGNPNQQLLGKSTVTLDNTSGAAAVPIQVIPPTEIWCYNWDSVTGAGAVTIANLLQEVYIASDHEVTTVAGSNSKAGRVFDVNSDGIWVYSGNPS